MIVSPPGGETVMEQSTSTYEESHVVPASRPRIGATVNGKYRLLRPLGQGGMGLVYEAEHLRLGQRVAIKFPRPDVLTMPDALARFEREARASVRLRGPHVVRVLDVDTDVDGGPYMVMDLVSGRNLEAELHARGRLPIEEAVDYMLQACAALAEAHAMGIVHRDLKPANLLLAEEGGIRLLKVLDFGVSKIAHDVEPLVTAATMTLGTPLYMSPEQLRSSRDVDARTDLWSLGVILYELLAGAPPFSGTTTAAIAAIVADAAPSLRDLRPEVPDRLERIIKTALAKAPADRYPSAEVFGAALMPFASPDDIAGPFSFRPSARAYETADAVLTRAESLPSRRRPADAAALSRRRMATTGAPSAGPGLISGRDGGRAVKSFGAQPVLRTFLSTVGIGMVLGTLVTRTTARASSDEAARRTLRAHAAANVAILEPRAAAERLGSAPILASAAGASAAMEPLVPAEHASPEGAAAQALRFSKETIEGAVAPSRGVMGPTPATSIPVRTPDLSARGAPL